MPWSWTLEVFGPLQVPWSFRVERRGRDLRFSFALRALDERPTDGVVEEGSLTATEATLFTRIVEAMPPRLDDAVDAAGPGAAEWGLRAALVTRHGASSFGMRGLTVARFPAHCAFVEAMLAAAAAGVRSAPGRACVESVRKAFAAASEPPNVL